MRRVVTLGLSSLSLVLLTAGPALAARDPLGDKEGADPGEPMSALHVLLLYVLLPLAVATVVGSIVWLPGAVRSNRYRPNRPWTATPVWFAGPAEPLKAVESAQVGDVERGGARGDW